MNEQIKQLADKAWATTNPSATTSWPAEFATEFASLISSLHAKQNKHLSHELLGVICDVSNSDEATSDGFDSICLDTVKRVHLALRGN